MAVLDAIAAALELVRSPVLVHAARRQPLPDGIAALLEIAVGDAERLGAASTATGRAADELRRAAGFYIEQILLDPDADSYRCLGVTDTASARDLRHHMALLTRWLHPDLLDSRSAGFDRGQYATRVTGAWENLKTPGRRESYDLSRRKTARDATARMALAVAPVAAAAAAGPASRATPRKRKPTTAAPAVSDAIPVEGKRRGGRRRFGLVRVRGDGMWARLINALRGEST